MKKLLQILTASIMSVAFIGVAAGAQGQPDCDILVINGTGPGSSNQVVCTVTTNATVVCTDNVYILDANSQSAATGAASNQGNVTGGTAITGNATNSNGQTVAIGASCGTVASPAPTPSTPVTPGKGSITPAQAAPAVLPYTAGASAEAIVVASLIAAAAIVVLSRVAVAAFRRISTK